ncbi:thiocillin family RiPP [Streptomyces iconiensis]|uniref:Thiocillin family RiPP n=1 Tax=Streptomyces iconiensis TaxID=1384038 RepID=A0ABT6ZUQ4_9ACTN|nr:thiocillin family RiPP [Streptomyces iconiensis]MDJ1132796.1 thiocillin family RiPP [Streptomyces iconiensis]
MTAQDTVQDVMAIDLSVEDMTVEPLADSALLGTAASWGTAASASCPAACVGTASSASSSG